MKKEKVSRKTIALSIFIVIIYYFMYMSPYLIMNIVNSPYSNSYLLLFFHNESTFSLMPLINISFNVFIGYVFLLCIPLFLSLYNYFTSK